MMPSCSEFFRFLESKRSLSVSKLSLDLESRLFDREREIFLCICVLGGDGDGLILISGGLEE